MSTSVTTPRAADPAQQLRAQLVAMSGELRNALPSHIKPEKFQRVVMTVVQQTPELLGADRRSLLASCTKCAADGLVPDGREAALVVFNTKNKDGSWEKRVQYMPMLVGILKRARNSGEIAGVIVNVVREGDEFTRRPDDFDKPVEHRMPKLGESRGRAIGAYALVKLKDGTIMHDVMDRDEIERVRAVSRAKDSGPWVQWWDEMARKTVFKRLSKYLPMDAEAEDFLRRDDEAEAAPVDSGPVIEGSVSAQGGSKLDAIEAAGEVDEALEGEIEDRAAAAPPAPSGRPTAATIIAAYKTRLAAAADLDAFKAIQGADDDVIRIRTKGSDIQKAALVDAEAEVYQALIHKAPIPAASHIPGFDDAPGGEVG